MTKEKSTKGIVASILSPVFNEEAYIAEMIKSVLSQSYDSFELIIVDDGSTDDTVRVAKEAALFDPRVRIISEGKRGKVGSFNRAFEECTGELIFLMGGDDRMTCRSLLSRVTAYKEAMSEANQRIAVYGRLRTFSEDRRYDGQTIPRRSGRGARSGGTMALSRPLAAMLFPIPAKLVAEDLWLGGGSEALADIIVDVDEIVLEYRIHAANSNPRRQGFESMSESMHARMMAYKLLAEANWLPFSEVHRKTFRTESILEEKRYGGRTGAVLLSRASPVTARLRAASMSSPQLFSVRQKLFKILSGW